MANNPTTRPGKVWLDEYEGEGAALMALHALERRKVRALRVERGALP